MTLRKCEKCGGEVNGDTHTCPACGAAVPPASQIPVAGPPSPARKNPIILISLVTAGLVVVLLLVFLLATRTPPVSAPEVAEVPDFEGTRAKAESGDANAQKKLGTFYAKGQGVKEDYKQAAKWYRQAADQGHAGAQVALGELYEAGQGVPHDDAEAAKSYRRAADQGHAAGQYSLAVLYVMGRGVPQNNAEALKWYRLAADQGDELAQYNLGMRYHRGIGVTPEPVEAYQWLTLAAAQGMPDAIQALDDLKSKMTRAQIAEGQRRAAAFVPKKTMPPAQ